MVVLLGYLYNLGGVILPVIALMWGCIFGMMIYGLDWVIWMRLRGYLGLVLYDCDYAYKGFGCGCWV